MKKVNQFETLSNNEMVEINGGGIGLVFGIIAAVCGAIYLAGEFAESAGRSYRKNYL